MIERHGALVRRLATLALPAGMLALGLVVASFYWPPFLEVQAWQRASGP